MSQSTTGLTSLSLQLTRARFVSREGESWLYLASTLAFVICSALALTVAGGTWMFINRWQHPTGILAELLAMDESYANVVMFYAILACIACALLIPSMVSLASAAAVLGARGRERRLSALRLLGLSAGDVTRMSLIDTLIQVAIGCTVGTGLYYLTLPLWSSLTMQAMPIQFAEMALPPLLLAAVLLVTVLVAMIASWWGLRQVRISPLGVARRVSRPKLRGWRAVAAVVVVVGAFVFASTARLGSSLLPWLIFGGAILAVIAGINLLAPWLLQQFSRVLAHAPKPAMMWASRRVQANPKATWQQASGLAVLAFIGGYIAMMPITLTATNEGIAQTFVESASLDFTKGALITLAVGMILTATSVLITQASAVLERAEQSRALTRMGAPSGFLTRVSWLETLGPLVVAIALGTGLGAAMASPMAKIAGGFGQEATMGSTILGTVLVVGVALVIAALLATRPLQRQVLGALVRRND